MVPCTESSKLIHAVGSQESGWLPLGERGHAVTGRGMRETSGVLEVFCDIYSYNYFRTFKLWLLFERPQEMINTGKIIEGSMFEMFYLTLK